MGTKLSEHTSTSKQLRTAESKARRRELAEAYRIGLDLHDLRCKHGLTQQQLADRSGVDQADICRIERGSTRPNTATLERLGDVLGAELRFVERPLASNRDARLPPCS